MADSRIFVRKDDSGWHVEHWQAEQERPFRLPGRRTLYGPLSSDEVVLLVKELAAKDAAIYGLAEVRMLDLSAAVRAAVSYEVSV